MAELPGLARGVLERGTFARLAVVARRGLHLTPLVYALSGERLWVTTARRSVKARAWERDPFVAGLVRNGPTSVSFVGSVTRHDALDPDTWTASIARTREIVRATRAFTLRNARFFAGYAVDARRVPLAWTPPGRVFAEISLDRGVVLDVDGVVSRWGSWREEPAGSGVDRSETHPRASRSTFVGVPSRVVDALERGGAGALALRSGALPPLVIPVSFSIDAGEVVVSAPPELVGAAGGPPYDVSLEVDAGSAWRARAMVGAFLSGRAETIRASAAQEVVLRVHTERVTWWQGWSSGTVSRR